ncbi:Anaerobic sulfatase-maturating enzyme [Raoultella terrigena]|uniref:Anaerobic sulfatase-maturating enzyme n=1 Tax=Raoultella terrigena TaxID=577 RepID=A0A4V6J1X5_RAOTE|nr:Anaerobic sulfatase-maturating enzyme [Raoultella terrigena]
MTCKPTGFCLNDRWAEFLKEHRFLVGLSIDGPRELHDRYRLTRSGKPTFDKVMAGANALKRHGVPFNALVTVNRTNARFPARSVSLCHSRAGRDLRAV